MNDVRFHRQLSPSKINDLPYLSCRIDLRQLSKTERPANPLTTLSAMPVNAEKRVH